MRIIKLDIDNYFTSTEYNPSPHRFSPDEKFVSERIIPIVYSCENCDFKISFKTEDFRKHHESRISNLKLKENRDFENYINQSRLNKFSSLVFHCPSCKQATLLLFEGGSSGYAGIFEFNIKEVLVLKDKSD